MPTPTTSSNSTNVSPANSLNIDALLGLIKWGGGAGTGVTLTYSFPWAAGGNAVFSGPGGVGNYSTANEQNAAQHYGLNATQQAGARAALQSWANVANISFQEVADTTSSVGDIRIAFSSAVGSQWWGYANYPNSYWPSGGDIWISSLNSGATDPNWASGSFNYFSLIHEIGHAMGLKHPFDGSPLLPTALDNRLYSVMSYTDPTNGLFRTVTNNPDGSFSFNYVYVPAETPMVLDIAAIQYLYGANMTYRTGNDVYSFSTTAPFFKTIWDAGGNDTISVSNFTENCRIDLTPGNYSSIRIVSAPLPPGYSGGTLPTYDGTNNLGIAYGAIIENAKGGSGADTLIGNDANNSLDGGAGNDAMTGGAGNDTLNGGAGNDTLSGGTGSDWAYYSTAAAGVTVNLNLTTAQATGGAGSDTLSGIENLLGSNYNDVLTGDSLANTLSGGQGADTLVGGLGNDTYVVDNAADVTTETSSLTTEIDTVQSSVSRALGINLENLVLTGTAAINGTGNALNNTITGNTAANTLNGSTGNDTLIGGAGNDTLIGGAGNDVYVIDASTTSANFAGSDNPAAWSASNGWGNGGMFLNTWQADHAVASAGNLNLKLDASGLIGGEYSSTSTMSYGMYSARMQVASGPGVVTSLFTYNGTPHDEIDIEFLGKDTTKVQFNYFVNGIGGHEVVINLGFDAAAGFHEYAFDWQPGSIRWYVDGVLKHEATTINGALPSAPGKLMANLWAAQGVDAWTGAFVPGTTHTAQYDWIKYQGDIVVENVGGGVDTVQSSSSYSLSSNVEDLTLTGATATNGSGNALNNTITGNAAANMLNGSTGNDILNGGAGNDTLTGGTGSDWAYYNTATAGVTVNLNSTTAQATGGAGSDTLSGIENLLGSNYNDVLTGDSLANTLNGGNGADTLIGGLGNDIYVVDNAADVTTETSSLATEIDTVQSSVTRTLGANLEKLILTGTTAISGTGNALNNTLTGNAAANTLCGGTGRDTLTGGSGNDIFDFNAIADSVVGVNQDVITDFLSGVDKIDLSGIDANMLLAGNQAFTLIAGTAAFSTAGQVKCTSSILYCEVNGDAVADFQISLTGVTTVTAADFML